MSYRSKSKRMSLSCAEFVNSRGLGLAALPCPYAPPAPPAADVKPRPSGPLVEPSADEPSDANGDFAQPARRGPGTRSARAIFEMRFINWFLPLRSPGVGYDSPPRHARACELHIRCRDAPGQLWCNIGRLRAGFARVGPGDPGRRDRLSMTERQRKLANPARAQSRGRR